MYRVVKEEAGRVCLAGWGGLGKVGGGRTDTNLSPFSSPPLPSAGLQPAAPAEPAGASVEGWVGECASAWVSVQAGG